MELKDIMTLSEVSEKYGIKRETLKKRLGYKSYNLVEGIDYKYLGPRMPVLLSPEGVKKIIKSNR